VPGSPSGTVSPNDRCIAIDPWVRVPASAVIAHLHEPGPYLFGPGVDRDGVGRLALRVGDDVVAGHRSSNQVRLHTLVGLVREFVPPMIERGGGAVLVATGASAMQRMPRFSAAAPALGAQRNYLQSLETGVGDKGVYVGRLYVGATIEHSVWHARQEAARGAGGASATKDRW
jgi:hypothetical protein